MKGGLYLDPFYNNISGRAASPFLYCDRGCKNSCVYGKQIFLIRNRYVKLCCRINDYAAVEYIFVLTVLPCRKIIYIIFDFFA